MVPDVLPKLLIEIREDSSVQAIVGTRVGSPEPAPPIYHPVTKALIEPGWARDKGSWVAFVVLVQLAAPRVGPRIPAQRAVVVARCYGRTPQEAAALRWAVSEAIHNLHARTHANGLGIYQSIEEAGGDQQQDPANDQPFQTLTITALATTQAVA